MSERCGYIVRRPPCVGRDSDPDTLADVDSLHFSVFLRRRTFNLYAYISSECDVNFVHCRIVYSLESHLVYKI